MPDLSGIARLRAANQRITGRQFEKPADAVAWMGMVQAQDYRASLWAIGLRTKSATEAMIEKAIADRSIVRTWPARGTIHFVEAKDVRWMLDLLAPRAMAGTSRRLRQLELDETTIARCRKTLAGALQGGKQLTRKEIFQRLEDTHISTSGQRGIHIIERLAQQGLICFGPRSGNQKTFVLLPEWVPDARRMAREDALAELASRYFASHGPATLQDFAWWAGLTLAIAKASIEMAGSRLVQEVVEGRSYWLSPSTPAARTPAAAACFLPAFDEFLLGYTDRIAVLEKRFARRANTGGGIIKPTIVFNGRIEGTWKRTFKRGGVVVFPKWFTKPDESRLHAITRAARQYARFLGLDFSLE